MWQQNSARFVPKIVAQNCTYQKENIPDSARFIPKIVLTKENLRFSLVRTQNCTYFKKNDEIQCASSGTQYNNFKGSFSQNVRQKTHICASRKTLAEVQLSGETGDQTHREKVAAQTYVDSVAPDPPAHLGSLI